MADPEQTPRLRPAHLLASSLAAVTGAFLASRLGVYGTVIGVGVISLFSTIGTDIYVRSLDRTRQMATRSKARTIALPASGPAVETVELPRTADTGELPEPAATKQLPLVGDPAGPSATDAAGDQPTAVIPGAQDEARPDDARPDDVQPGYPNPADRDREATTEVATGRTHPDSDARVTEPPADSNPSRWTKARVLFVAAGAVASFVLAFVLITGIESVSGSSLSGGGRTTLGELIVDGGNSSPEDRDSDDVDGPELPVPTPEPTTPPPIVPDPPDGDEPGVPPAEEAPEVEEPSDPETPSPSPTESPTSEPSEPAADGREDSSAGSTDSQATGG